MEKEARETNIRAPNMDVEDPKNLEKGFVAV
jgi:hypothetical protein